MCFRYRKPQTRSHQSIRPPSCFSQGRLATVVLYKSVSKYDHILLKTTSDRLRIYLGKGLFIMLRSNQPRSRSWIWNLQRTFNSLIPGTVVSPIGDLFHQGRPLVRQLSCRRKIAKTMHTFVKNVRLRNAALLKQINDHYSCGKCKILLFLEAAD